MIWGSPLWVFFGVWALAVWRARYGLPDRPPTWAAWAVVAAGTLIYFPVKVTLDPYVRGEPTRAHFPGRELADAVLRRWQARYETPFPIVGGEPWRAGNICCYARHRPGLYSGGRMGYLDMPSDRTPFNDYDLLTRGGVIVWDAGQLGDAPPAVLLARFPGIEAQPSVTLRFQTGARLPAVRTGVAFVPPCGCP